MEDGVLVILWRQVQARHILGTEMVLPGRLDVEGRREHKAESETAADFALGRGLRHESVSPQGGHAKGYF